MSDDALAVLTAGVSIGLVALSAWIRGRNDEREARLVEERARDAADADAASRSSAA